jgi:hypothetical protein
MADAPGLIWLEKLQPSIIALSTFGGSITFSIIPSISDNPPNQRFSAQNVRTSLAVVWLFFVLALGVAAAGEAILAFQRPVVNSGFLGEEPPAGNRWASLVILWFCKFPLSLLLQVLVLLAFLFSALVVVAYVGPVGWVAVACTAVFIVIAVVIWVVHDCC